MRTVFQKRINKHKPQNNILNDIPSEEDLQGFMTLKETLGELEKQIYYKNLSNGLVKVRLMNR